MKPNFEEGSKLSNMLILGYSYRPYSYNSYTN